MKKCTIIVILLAHGHIVIYYTYNIRIENRNKILRYHTLCKNKNKYKNVI